MLRAKSNNTWTIVQRFGKSPPQIGQHMFSKQPLLFLAYSMSTFPLKSIWYLNVSRKYEASSHAACTESLQASLSQVARASARSSTASLWAIAIATTGFAWPKFNTPSWVPQGFNFGTNIFLPTSCHVPAMQGRNLSTKKRQRIYGFIYPFQILPAAQNSAYVGFPFWFWTLQRIIFRYDMSRDDLLLGHAMTWYSG